jgi:hypothetical protein
MAKSDALQRQLDNDEPKCGNCAHWSQDVNGEELAPTGICTRPRFPIDLRDGTGFAIPLRTFDLAVCSKWEAKS